MKDIIKIITIKNKNTILNLNILLKMILMELNRKEVQNVKVTVRKNKIKKRKEIIEMISRIL